MDIIPPKNQPPVMPVNNEPGPPLYPTPSRGPAAGQRPQAGKPHHEHHFRNIASTIALFASAFLIAILLNTFVIQSYQVDGESMEPTLQNNDRLIVNKVPRTIARFGGHQYVPHRGDIIIFNQDGLPGFVGQKQLIKRVMGLPGEHVVVADGKVTIYNKEHPQGFSPDAVGGYQTSSPTTVGNFNGTLKANELFVCGDNRPNSEDSRYFGPITTNQVVAKLELRILPLNKSKAF